MKAIIIEDEKLSAEHLENLLRRIDSDVEVIGVFDSVKKSAQAFKNGLTADVLFLDIHLADGLSFEIFEDVRLDIPVIFTTAFNEYAIKAFDLNSIDYLLKPIGKEELQKALDKFDRLKQQHSSELINRILPLIRQGDSFKNRFLVKLGEQIISLKTEEIHHFIAEDGIVLLVNQQGKRFPVDFTLDQLEQQVSPKLFFRINRKVLIHIEQVKKMSSYFNSRLKIQAEFLPEESAIVSRERVQEFKTWLDS